MNLRDLARPDWHNHAACIGADLEWFYPDRGQTDRPAIALCFRCPVRHECLKDAMSIKDGIMGGTHGSTRNTWRGTLDELYATSRIDAEARALVRREGG